MVSRKEGWTNPEESNEKKNIKTIDQLIGKISTLHGNMKLDITAGSMSGTPAAVVYDTMLSGVAFVIDHFNYTEVPCFLDEIKVSQLPEKLMEDFLGKLTERTLGKNLRIGDMARRITNCAFTHLLGHIVTKEQDAVVVSIRQFRPAAEETCMYTVDEIEDDQGFLWMPFDIRHEQLLNSMIFGNVSRHLEKGKRLQKICVTKCCLLDR